MGVATSQYNTLNSMYLNPANLGGMKEKFAIQLFSLNLGVDNNLGTFNGLSDMFKANNSDSGTSVFNLSSQQKYFSMLLPTLEFRGPGAVISINNKMAFGLNTRMRMINQLNHFDRSIYDQVVSPSAPATDYSLEAQNFNWTAHMWSEIGLSFGMTVLDEEEDAGVVKVGATVRRLSGIGYIGLKGNRMDIDYTAGNERFYASNADLQFVSNLISTQSAIFKGIDGSVLFSNLFGGKGDGGFGADIGATYARKVYFGDNDDDGHRVSAGISVNDLGGINYKRANHGFDIKGNGYLEGKKISGYDGDIDSIRAYAKRQGFTGDTTNASTRVHLPTAMVIGADVQLYKKLFLNVTYIANLANRNTFGNSVYNRLCITPRLDMRGMTLSLPIAYSALAKDVKMGLGFRFGGFIFGSDDMLAFVSKKRYGINAYFGFAVPIYRKNNKSGKPSSAEEKAPPTWNDGKLH